MTTPAPDAAHEEVDVWWGSCAGRTLMPSFIVCGVLTALVYFAVHYWVPQRGWQQATFTLAAGIVWVIQLARWSHRFFACNYRLTTRYLYIDRGFRHLVAQRIDLRTIRDVKVVVSKLDQWLGVGNVEVYVEGGQKPAAVLDGLVHSHRARDMIGEMAAKARSCDKQ